MKNTGHVKPQDTKKAMVKLLRYIGHYKFSMLFIAILVIISAFSGIMGTYLLKPVINEYILPGNIPGLVRMIFIMGLIYLAGAFPVCFITE